MNLLHSRLRAGSRPLVCGLLLATGACTTPMPSAPVIDDAAREDVDRMRDAIAQLTQYRMTIESLTDEPSDSGVLVQVARTTRIAVARPDRMALTVERDDGGRWSAWLQAGQFVILDEEAGIYARVTLPAEIDEALEALGDAYGLELPLSDVISGLRREDLLSRVEAGMYVGPATIAGRPCHHVLFRQPVADWQAWIEKGDPALPRRIQLTYKDEPGTPGYMATITEWDIAAKLSEDTWKPKLPGGAREVAFAELTGKEESP